MDTLDKWSIALLDEIVIIVKRLHLKEDFIINCTPRERKHLLKIVNDIIKDEKEQNEKIKSSTSRLRSTR